MEDLPKFLLHPVKEVVSESSVRFLTRTNHQRPCQLGNILVMQKMRQIQ